MKTASNMSREEIIKLRIKEKRYDALMDVLKCLALIGMMTILVGADYLGHM